MISDLSKHCLLLLLIVASIGPGGVQAQAKDTEPAQETPQLNDGKQDGNAMETPAKGSQGPCKKNEILTVERGCVDSKNFIKSIVLSKWTQIAKKSECLNNQILVGDTCKLKSEQVIPERVAVEPNYLHNGKLYRSQAEVPKVNPGKTNLVAGIKESNRREDAQTDIKLRNMSKENVRENAEDGSSSQRVIGHNRPRHYEFLPGRMLKTYRTCRPYEVLGVKNRCIRKKGKVGFYKHKNHVYGSPNQDDIPSLQDQQQ